MPASFNQSLRSNDWTRVNRSCHALIHLLIVAMDRTAFLSHPYYWGKQSCDPIADEMTVLH